MKNDIKSLLEILLQDYGPEMQAAYYKYVADNNIDTDDAVFKFFVANGIYTYVIQKTVADSFKAADQIKLNANDSISMLESSTSRQAAELRQIIADFPKQIENSVKSLELLLRTHNFPQVQSTYLGGQSLSVSDKAQISSILELLMAQSEQIQSLPGKISNFPQNFPGNTYTTIPQDLPLSKVLKKSMLIGAGLITLCSTFAGILGFIFGVILQFM